MAHLVYLGIDIGGTHIKTGWVEHNEVSKRRTILTPAALEPFKEAIKNDIEMIMVAHLHCTCFDKEENLPTSLSANAVGYLRNTLGYRGVVITDDMVMKGVQDFGSLEACIMAIKAGVDMFIFRNSDEDTIKHIENLLLAVEKDDELKTKIIESNERILKLKKRYGIL